MNKQIEDFKERVRLTPEEKRMVEVKASNEYKESIDYSLGKFASYNLQRAITNAVAQAQLDKVLNHPDIALIDRRNYNAFNKHEVPKGAELAMVIPLAEAISKEVK